ncbi:MAG: HEAT repeat domain-containing protein, partial [Planctomycetes bacterium]|nr:HEAT repeat domain-containing protein [Planctomycetota bacterium]
KLTRAAHISPDLVEGHHQLETQRRDGSHVVTVPRLRTWSIVMLEYDADAEPDFPVTTPVKDAREYLEKRREKRKTKTAKKPKKKKKVPYYRDYERHENVDAKRAEKMERPEEIVLRRNGELDVHHARGAFSWLNPVGSAVGLLGGGRYDPSWVDYVGFKLNRTRGCMDEFPDSYERLLAYDVVVLDDVHSFYLGSTRRVKIADFVRNGGGLVYFGGYFNLSLGADHNTFIEEILPVRIKNYADIQRDDKGLPLRPVDKTFFEGMVDLSKPPVTFVVDTSDIDDQARVLVRAGDHPAIVASRYGEGRVVTMLINPHGGRPDDVTPYWEWPQWPRVLSACVRWAAEGWQEEDKTGGKKRTADKSKPQPMDLMMEAFDLDSAAFTKKVKQARVNVVDAESAKVMLETAVGNVDKIEDLDLLKQIVDDAAPYFNKDFAPLGKKLISSEHWFIREAGYQILGRAGDPEYRELLEKGLQDGEPRVVRQALVGLGRLGVAESRPALRRYLKGGSEKLLAAAALKRSGSEQIIEPGLKLYGKEMTHKIHLKCGRRSLESTLWGGVSFKLTREQRKKLMADYRELRRVERQVKFDINFFEESLTSLSEGEMQNLVEFMTETEKREVLPFAYEFFANLPDQKAEKYVPQLKDARLDELRMLAEF